MGFCAFNSREAVQRDVVISTEHDKRVCQVLIDADCWPAGGVIAGVLDLPKPEWEPLARNDRLVLTLTENGEPYRMILDGNTGRFIARQL